MMSTASQSKFSPLLLLALVAPLLLSAAGWLVQFFARFPPRSLGTSLTAVTFLAAPLIELLAVPVAIATLVRRPESRTIVNVSLTLFCTLILMVALLLTTLVFTHDARR